MDTNLNFVSFKKILIKKDFRSKHKVKTICIQETIFEKKWPYVLHKLWSRLQSSIYITK